MKTLVHNKQTSQIFNFYEELGKWIFLFEFGNLKKRLDKINNK